MILEYVSTRFPVGRFEDYLDEHGHHEALLLARHLPIAASFVAATGSRNRIVRLVAYEDFAQRSNAVAALLQDPDWRAFRRGPGGTALEEETFLLNPTAFSELHDRASLDAAIADAATRSVPMLFELRTYTVIPGKMPNALRMLIEEGNPLTHEFVEWPVGYFTAETGITNRVMMLWAYTSASERARRKALMLPDPRFQELGSRFNLNFSEQRSELLEPYGASPLR